MNAGILDKVVRNAKLLINYNKPIKPRHILHSVGKFSTIRSVFLVAALVLSGCDNWGQKSIAQICKDSPAYCNDLNPDAWCRSEKADIIRHRHEHAEGASHKQNYAMLLKWEAYKACVAKAAGIRHIKHREKEAGRMKGLLTAERELKRLGWQTKNADDPYLSYYHWSRFSDTQAKQRFMQFAEAGRLHEDPDLLVALASIQIKVDEDGARETLYQALERVDEKTMVSSDVFLSLSTLALDNNRTAAAYLWAQIAEYYEAPVDMALYEKMAIAAEVDIDKVEELADQVIADLENGEFSAYTLGIHRL